MRYIFALLVLMDVYFADDFITAEEYAKMLYQNPRGIGCYNCHGEKGDGEVITTYIQDYQIKELSAPSIRRITFKKFKKALSKNHDIMPRYFLTDSEIMALYDYVHKKR